ncbi:MAG: hypothetical protein JWO06_3425 [Bacteroidota bacterium]|nr:hypothetical protein [Bacteroidota bacterium]
MEIDIPDATGTGRSFRKYTAPISNPSSSDPLFCFPTERFMDQYLKSFVLQVKAVGSFTESVAFSGFAVNSVDSLGTFLPEPIYLGDSMVAQFSNQLDITSPPYTNFGGPGGTLLALYSDTTYPSPATYSHLRIFPTNPQDTVPEVIDVTMSPNFDLMFQPYTDFVAAKVYNHPDTTHTINLMLTGATYCISPFIEVMINPGTKFIYRSGHLDFGGPGSCMQFMPGTKLIVDTNATLNYAEATRGVLLLRENSSIELRPNSSLNLYGSMVLGEYDRWVSGQVYMTLPPFTTLRFEPGSHIINYSVDQKMRLNVYMKGGILDDSGLSDDEKLNINRIYDNQDLLEDFVSIYPNPSSGSTGFKITAASDEKGEIQIFNLQGQVVFNNSLQLQKGINIVSIAYGNLPTGEYIMRLKGAGLFNGKMIVIN